MSTSARYYFVDDSMLSFDQLFEGGRIKWEEKSPLCVLIRGEEGSGKSTLALQMACLGKTVTQSQLIQTDRETSHTRCILYYVVDDFVERIKEKYETFGLDTREVIILKNESLESNGSKSSISNLIVLMVSRRQKKYVKIKNIISSLLISKVQG